MPARDVAFVGGSLVPLGGHNLLEPAACGVPVLFGPHTENVAEAAAELLAARGAVRVAGARELAATVGRCSRASRRWPARWARPPGAWSRPIAARSGARSSSCWPRSMRRSREARRAGREPRAPRARPSRARAVGLGLRGRGARAQSAATTAPAPRRRARLPGAQRRQPDVGGTGKTPDRGLARRAAASRRGARPAIVSRGYGGRAGAGPLCVSAGAGPCCEPSACGDEPFLLARAVPEAIVDRGREIAGPVPSSRTALGADVVVLDDGFQHRRLARDLDIVLLDAAPSPRQRAAPAPPGRLREPIAALGRADVVLLTRADAPRDPVEHRAGGRRLSSGRSDAALHAPPCRVRRSWRALAPRPRVAPSPSAGSAPGVVPRGPRSGGRRDRPLARLRRPPSLQHRRSCPRSSMPHVRAMRGSSRPRRTWRGSPAGRFRVRAPRRWPCASRSWSTIRNRSTTPSPRRWPGGPHERRASAPRRGPRLRRAVRPGRSRAATRDARARIGGRDARLLRRRRAQARRARQPEAGLRRGLDPARGTAHRARLLSALRRASPSTRWPARASPLWRWDASCEYEGLEHIRAAYARGRGVLLFSGHYGHWELDGPHAGLARAAARAGHPPARQPVSRASPGPHPQPVGQPRRPQAPRRARDAALGARQDRRGDPHRPGRPARRDLRPVLRPTRSHRAHAGAARAAHRSRRGPDVQRAGRPALPHRLRAGR